MEINIASEESQIETLVIDRDHAPEQEVRNLVTRLQRLPGVLSAIPIRSKQNTGGKRDGAIVACPAASATHRNIFRLADRNWRIRHYAVPDTGVLDRPTVIIGAPRSGTTLLFETLSQLECAWTIGRESHRIIEGIGKLRPSGGTSSNRLQETDADQASIAHLRTAFACSLRNRDGDLYVEAQARGASPRVRFIEKTPRNTLRIPFLRKVLPGARFVFLHRDPRENISSLIEGWNSNKYISYTWEGKPWSFLLPPGWQEVSCRPVEEIAAFQWRLANEYSLADLASLPAEDWLPVSYTDLVRQPEVQIRRICEFAELPLDAGFRHRLTRPLPPSSSTLRSPAPDKWKMHSSDIERIMPALVPLAERLRELRSLS